MTAREGLLDRTPAGDVVELDGRSLAPAAVAALAAGRAQARLAPVARARNAAARATLEALVANGTPVYGVTTGVGALHDRRLDPDDAPEHQRRLLRSHAAGAGEPLAPDVVIAAMAVRLNQLGAGGAGASDDLLDALGGALAARVIPVVREIGSLGTGDLPALADIGLALTGEGEVDRGGARAPAARALAEAGVTLLALGPRDGIALMSSNAVTIARAALIAVRARRIAEASLTVAALSFEAVDADRSVLDARVHAARPHPGQVAVAARMRSLLEGGAATRRRGGVHDPFAFRCQPQVDGTLHDAIARLDDVLEIELNAAAENPLLVSDEAAALASGNFHAGALALALDGLRAALAQAASLVAARVSALLEARYSGLRGWLATARDTDPGVMALEYTAHAAAAEVRLLAAPASAQHTSVGSGMESHASFAPTAARHSDLALDRYADAVATELAVAVRALRMRGEAPAGTGTRELFDRAAAALPADLGNRPPAADLALARDLVAGKAVIHGGPV
ncbi:MAG: histidine ammonia-lyase [Solirubrobacteraceae bacterium]|nr:histidine ammonia-lyase [Solirubrobacteraceae bacterium]